MEGISELVRAPVEARARTREIIIGNRLCEPQAVIRLLLCRIKRGMVDAKDGDIFLPRLHGWNPTCVYDSDGPKLSIDLVPRKFLVPTRFPVDYWKIGEFAFLVPLDVAGYRREMLNNLSYDIPPEIIPETPRPHLAGGTHLFHTFFYHAGIKHILMADFNQSHDRPPEDEIMRVLEDLRELLTDTDNIYVRCETEERFWYNELWRHVRIAPGTKILEYPRKLSLIRGIESLRYRKESRYSTLSFACLFESHKL